MVNRETCHPLGEEITAHMLELFKGMGCNQSDACRFSEGVSDTLLTLYAGQDVHFPANRQKKIRERNQVIQQAFDGSNARALARHHGLSVQAIYRIIKNGSSSGRYIPSD